MAHSDRQAHRDSIQRNLDFLLAAALPGCRLGMPGQMQAQAFARMGAQWGEMVLQPGGLERWAKSAATT